MGGKKKIEKKLEEWWNDDMASKMQKKKKNLRSSSGGIQEGKTGLILEHLWFQILLNTTNTFGSEGEVSWRPLTDSKS